MSNKSYNFFHTDCINLDAVGFSLLYINPPLGSKSEDKTHGVGDNQHDYLEFMYDRLFHLKTLLLPDSNVLLHADQRNIHSLKVMMDVIFGRENFRNEIIQVLPKLKRKAGSYARKHKSLLWYRLGQGYMKGGPFIDSVWDSSIVLEKYALHLWSIEGDMILDPFLKDGSFVEAALGLKRPVVGCSSDANVVSELNKRCNKLIEGDLFSWQ